MEQFFEQQWLSILPPLITITIAIISRKAAFSLVLGVVVGSIITAKGINLDTFGALFSYLAGVFVKDGQMRWDNLSIFMFLWLLGILTSLLTSAGSLEALADILTKRIKTKRNAQFSICLLGFVIFIDDFFNCLAVGSVTQSLADRTGISRAKLAYFLDSTAGPVCVLMPISSWGATIVVLMDSTINNLSIPGVDGFALFAQSAPYNFYAIFTIILILIVALTNFDFPLMRKHELEAMKNKVEKQVTKESSVNANSVILPIAVLTFGSIFSMFFTGYLSCEVPTFSVLEILKNTRIGPSLVMGALASVATALYYNPMKISSFIPHCSEGFKMMRPAIVILYFSWALAGVIHHLEAGLFICSLIHKWEVSIQLLPAIVFIVAAIMSFSTGTSWATFSLLIPIVAEIAVIEDVTYLPLLFGAVLGGAVFGDHSSPISDTSILSSIGAGCVHMDHVLTQLPYCILAASLSLVGYVVIGLYGVTALLLVAGIGYLAVAFAIYLRRRLEVIAASQLENSQLG